ncbi:hypothetical protein GJAV_G00155650 [Gymnothorax javanicus]|nr:hypothetical protein GJAV_G00155650 [Gymnothorax javanicus]
MNSTHLSGPHGGAPVMSARATKTVLIRFSLRQFGRVLRRSCAAISQRDLTLYAKASWMEGVKELEEGEEYTWRRRQSVRMLQGMLKRVGPAALCPNQTENAVNGAVGGAVGVALGSKLHPALRKMKPDAMQAAPPDNASDPFLATPPKPDLFQATRPTPDLFQDTPPTPDLFQATPSAPDLFQATPPTPDLFRATSPKPDLFQATPPTPDLFHSTPHKPDLFQATPYKPDLFQATPHKPDLFQATPPTPDLFQATPHKPDLFQATAPKFDLFQATPPNPDLFQATHPKPDLFQATHPKPDLSQATPPQSDLFQATTPQHDFIPRTPPKHCIPPVPPRKPKPFQATPPKHDIIQAAPSESDLFLATPPKPDLFLATPPKPDLFQRMPPKPDLYKATPPHPDLFPATPPKPDLFQATPHKSDVFLATPPKYDLFSAIPPKPDLFQATPPEPDIFQAPPPERDLFQATPSKHDIIPTVPLKTEELTSGDSQEYPVFENILFIGEEKCVEDWPEGSPELWPDWKPPGKLRLRRDSLKEWPGTMKEKGNKDLEENIGNDGKTKKGRRFTLPSFKEAKSDSELSEKGADLFKGREGEGDEQDLAEECKMKPKRGRKFKLIFPQRRDSKSAELPGSPAGAACRNLSEAAESDSELSEKGADLFKGREGEGDEQDLAEECKMKPKRGRKFKLIFPQRRDSKSAELPGSPAASACRNLSEAAEAEWLAAQKDESWMFEGKGEESGVEDGDTDSLMEWWNTVEQWDELPSDEEDLPAEGDVKQQEALSGKVQKGIHVFNKLFMEQAEGLWMHISALCAIAENLSEFHKKAKIASITGGTTSAVGGVTAITGLVLAPFTLGATLAITAVGIGIATAGGITTASATISDSVNSSHDRKKVERIVQDYQAKMADINKCVLYVQQGLERLLARNLQKMDVAGRQDAGLSRSVQMASEASSRSERAVQISSQVNTMLTGLHQGMDKYYMEQDSRELKKSCKTEFGAQIRHVAERLHEALVELNSIREELQDTVYNI